MNDSLVNLSDSKYYEDGVSLSSRNENSKLLFVSFVVTIPGILWNGLLLLCIYRNKNAIWIKDTKNVIHNIISDFVISILNTVIVAITITPEEIQWPLEMCYIKNYFTVTLQCISLNHILALCIDRFRKAVNVTKLQRSEVSPYKRSIAIWICTSIVGLAPFVIQINEQQAHKLECTSKTVALVLSTRLVLIFHIIVTSVPWFITNLLFFVTSVILWRKIGTVRSVQCQIQQAENITEMHSDNRGTDDQRTVNSIRYISQPNDQSSVIGVHGTNANSEVRRTKIHVMVTIGLLLIVFNISMWPLVIGLIGLQLSEPFELKGRFYIFLFLNQTLNPLIYVIRLARLRQAFKEFLRSSFNCN